MVRDVARAGVSVTVKEKVQNIEVGYIVYLKSPFFKFRLFGMLWKVK